MTQEYVPFSMRVGATKLPQLGLQDMPTSLRVSLWNVIEPWIWQAPYGDEYNLRVAWVYNFRAIRWPTDEAPSETYKHRATERLKSWMLGTAEWNEVYEFVEALPRMVWHGLNADPDNLREVEQRGAGVFHHGRRVIGSYVKNLNAMLTREGAPYQYRSGYLVPITSKEELAEITRALDKTPFHGPRMHINTAIAKLAERPTPDFRNSIKESVSAVESLLQEATGLKGEKLPRLLDAFDVKYKTDLHGGFKSALGSLYGWTSDDGGIRHGIFGGETVGHAEAQFMLVTCSALVNFLVAKTT